MSSMIIKKDYIPALIFILFVILSFWVYQNYITNLSPSEPVGIYKIIKSGEIKRGDIVAICLSKEWQDYGLQRHYLLPGIRCQGSAPLIKTVIAVPGDTVVLNDDKIVVNEKTFFYATQYFDSKHRPLKTLPRGDYKNIKGYFLIGTHDTESWDSRYWGFVNRSMIRFELKPFFM
jgi:conjugative transfer signal peptidase TraF